MNILDLTGLSTEILSSLSYESKLNISLRRNLHYFDKDALLNELFDYVDWLDELDIWENVAIDYRIKSRDSIILKYNRYYPDHQAGKVFNDIVGFRGFCDKYDDVMQLDQENLRIVDMSKGKANDDGYRGVHIYYQKDNKHYPIEIQFNTLYDRQLNNWLHDYVYKKNYSNIIGIKLRLSYESGKIHNDTDFKEELNNVLLSC